MSVTVYEDTGTGFTSPASRPRPRDSVVKSHTFVTALQNLGVGSSATPQGVYDTPVDTSMYMDMPKRYELSYTDSPLVNLHVEAHHVELVQIYTTHMSSIVDGSSAVYIIL
jgi:hypothetical protein